MLVLYPEILYNTIPKNHYFIQINKSNNLEVNYKKNMALLILLKIKIKK